MIRRDKLRKTDEEELLQAMEKYALLKRENRENEALMKEARLIIERFMDSDLATEGPGGSRILRAGEVEAIVTYRNTNYLSADAEATIFERHGMAVTNRCKKITLDGVMQAWQEGHIADDVLKEVIGHKKTSALTVGFKRKKKGGDEDERPEE